MLIGPPLAWVQQGPLQLHSATQEHNQTERRQKWALPVTLWNSACCKWPNGEVFNSLSGPWVDLSVANIVIIRIHPKNYKVMRFESLQRFMATMYGNLERNAGCSGILSNAKW
ncbi:10019_t:CDS:2 [Acaulospora colombiana]|uniref:10019_t:CDS:1 n=1 Tax=Acaulospora colombiana TaxID=27376 RepID=A0ACA9P1X1_9GLOM|nr:10019_t:CDS:2 [Acaulospora colombiana]